jgi:outer membrane protein OmpA-like peptidoglycan-associated protein
MPDMKRMAMKIFLLLTSVFLVQFSLLCPVSAQTGALSTRSKKAEKFFYAAVSLSKAGAYDKALAELEKAIGEDPAFIEAYIMKGDLYSDLRSYEDAIGSYNQAIGINPEYSPHLYYILANVELSNGKYQDARTHYEKYLSYEIPPDRRGKAVSSLRACEFGIHAMENPVPFNPVNLGDSINTPLDEYVNAITADDSRIYFTRKVERNAPAPNALTALEEDFYVSLRCDTGWHLARDLGPPINTEGNEGALFISADGQTLFFAACDRPDGYGSCDIYWSKKMGDRWSEPVNLGPVVNSGAWDSQPSFSSDGKTLYFASKRPGGKGSSDIWKTELQPDGVWSRPVNLGDSINTALEEMSPFIHPDDRTLYFSSRGHPGLGGLDLFISRKNIEGIWMKPVNLGYPINSFRDEISLVVDASGERAYISSDKPGGKGRQDIYVFRLYPEAQPVKVTYFKGIVFDRDTKKRLQARFELTDLGSGKVVVRSESDPVTGAFLLALPTECSYALNVSKDGYLFYSDHFELRGETSQAKPVLRDVPLQPVKVGQSVVLRNIFFDTDKAVLKPESLAELRRLTELLKANPSVRIEISGHTDNVGTPEYNVILSKNRARAVYDYLVQNGIAGERLTYAGYGLTRPVDTNETEEGRANNRRTEFKVTGQ